MRVPGIMAALLLCAVTGGLSACDERGNRQASLSVDRPIALADQPIAITVSGLAAGEEVAVAASAFDHRLTPWRSQANFRADKRGMVDLGQSRPIAGTYSDTDGMGLFWSMNPATGNPDEAVFTPRFPEAQPAYPVQVTVTAHGRQLAQRILTRQWLAPGVTHRSLAMRAEKVVGDLFLPSPRTQHGTAVLVLGGSEGGNDAGKFESALLASHGYTALALTYFDAPGLPSELDDIPLEYFVRAARLLAAQPFVDPARLIVHGYSRGTEAAQLLAHHYPQLIRGAILHAPAPTANQGVRGEDSAWSRNGRPIPRGPFKLDRVNGPLLTIAGTDDQIWPAAAGARKMMSGLDRTDFPHQALTYPGAGHGVGTFPHLAAGTRFRHPVSGGVVPHGGTRAANAAAQAQSWPKVLAFLARVGH